MMQSNFSDLISDREFENNHFLKMPDALAVISLAKTSNMFDAPKVKNHLSVGVCYNNIANLQLKNGKY